MLVLIIQTKKWINTRDEEAAKRLEELNNRVTETQNLFRQEVSTILSNLKQLVK